MKTAEQQKAVNRRALSMWQPFASLLAAGIKTVESRSLNTKYRGEFYIHASQAIPRIVYDDWYLKKPLFRQVVNNFLHVPQNSTLSLRDLRAGFTLGALVGKATLTDSLPSTALYGAYMEQGLAGAWEIEEALGDHGPERWAWVVENPEKLIAPTPIKGRQMLFWPIGDTFVINP